MHRRFAQKVFRPQYRYAAVRLCVVATMLSSAANAQQSSRSGRPFLSAHLAEATWAPVLTTRDGNVIRRGRDRGLGFGVGFGYELTSRLGVYASGEKAWVEHDRGYGHYALTHGTLGMRYSVGSWRVRPFVDIALGGRTGEVQTDSGTVDVRGAALAIGAGIRWSIARDAALNARLRRITSNFHVFNDDRVHRGFDVDDTPSYHVSVGIDWYPRWP